MAFTATFVSDEPTLANWTNTNVQIIELLCDVDNPNHLIECDAEVLPMVRISHPTSKEVTLAYSDELSEDDQPEELKLVLDGIDAYLQGNTVNPYSGGYKAQYFECGLKIGPFKV